MKSALLAGLLVATVVSAATAWGAPRGAVKLSPGNLFTGNGFVCGRGSINAPWRPGRMLPTGHFYGHLTEAQNLAKAARSAQGRAKANLKQREKTRRNQHAARLPVCLGGPPTPTPAATPTPRRTNTPVPTSTPTAVPTVTPTPTSTPAPLVFNLTGAVALGAKATPTPASAPLVMALEEEEGSGLLKIDEDGNMSEAVSSGTADIENFLIAPNGDTFVLFREPVNLENTAELDWVTGCRLARIDRETGEPLCIENELNIRWPAWPPTAKALQFDSAGNVYYVGYLSTETQEIQKLRKWVGGVKTDLLSGEDRVWDMEVLPDGRMIITGITGNDSIRWIRRLNPDNTSKTLYDGVFSHFLKVFPDNNVYMGGWFGPLMGIGRYISAEDEVTAQLWVSSQTMNTVYRPSELCGGYESTIPGYCGFSGSNVKFFFTTSSNEVYAVAGYADIGDLMKYYPTVASAPSAVKKIRAATAIGDTFVLAGPNAADQHIMTLYDSTTSTETELIGPTNEIEIFKVEHLAASNSLMFDGRRVSDDQLGIGVLNLSTLEVTFTPSTEGRLANIESLEQ